MCLSKYIRSSVGVRTPCCSAVGGRRQGWVNPLPLSWGNLGRPFEFPPLGYRYSFCGDKEACWSIELAASSSVDDLIELRKVSRVNFQKVSALADLQFADAYEKEQNISQLEIG